MAQRMGMLIDVSKCMGCRACQVACKQWNQLPAVKTHFSGSYQNPPHLNANTWTLIQFIEPDNEPVRWLFRKQQCLHCGDPSCLQVCPTGAIKKQSGGAVVIDQHICAGCKNCTEACPFHVPKADHTSGTAKKCRLCLDRIQNGLKPACATACPTGAVQFGTRDEMLQLAKSRQAVISEQTGKTPRIYGEAELGGLGVMYLLPEKASVYGLPETPRKPTARIALKWLAGLIPGAAILYGMLKAFGSAGEKAAADEGTSGSRPASEAEGPKGEIN
jgi:formate dehydrogenase iron-sulfur subunit